MHRPRVTILQAGSLVRVPGPRFELHGEKGSLVKHGLDPQAKMLEDELRTRRSWSGLEPEDRHATLTTEVGGLPVTGPLATLPGAWPALLGRWPAPSTVRARCRSRRRRPEPPSGCWSARCAAAAMAGGQAAVSRA